MIMCNNNDDDNNDNDDNDNDNDGNDDNDDDTAPPALIGSFNSSNADDAAEDAAWLSLPPTGTVTNQNDDITNTTTNTNN